MLVCSSAWTLACYPGRVRPDADGGTMPASGGTFDTEVRVMRWSMVAFAGAILLLVIADALAFHDVFEPHTVRDWLMLAGSALVVVGVLGSFDRRSGPGARTPGGLGRAPD
jgi:hypothetical protein